MEWRIVKEIPIYSVSDTGEVKNNITGRILIPIYTKGYMMVHLYYNSQRYDRLVHRLVATEFIPNPQNKPFINHIDGSRNNNNVNNLEWCTHQENILHFYRVSDSTIAREKIRLSKLGIKRSDATKEKISLSKKGKYTLSKHPRAKKVMRIEDMQIFSCIIEASMKTQTNPKSITMVCRGKRNTAGGFHWKYINEKEK